MTDPFDDETRLKRAVEFFEISSIIKRFGSWVVTTYGIENLEHLYPIDLSRVEESDWVAHMRQKHWVDIGDFIDALTFAKALHARRKLLTIEGRSLNIFLCHASEDKTAVLKLKQQLLDVGTAPWIDKDKLLPGQDWKLEIERALSRSDIVLVCLSKVSVKKTGFVQRELKIALDAAAERPEGQIFIVPARLDECDPPDSLRKIQRVDLFESDGFERLVQALEHFCKERRAA